MNDEPTNVIPLEPRRLPTPPLRCELRLNDEDLSIEMILRSETGEVIALGYTLTSKPADFDADRYRAAWDEWRGSSAVAS